jgi:hypothetical protein
MGHRPFWSLLVLLGAALPVLAEPPSPTPLAFVKDRATPVSDTATEHPSAEPFLPKTDAEMHAEEGGAESQDAALPTHRLWATGDYLLWRIRDSRPPVLATSGQSIDPVPGAIGSPNTLPILGGTNLDNRNREGGRFFLGGWLDTEEVWGAEAGGFFLGSRTVGATITNGFQDTDTLARPFFNTLTGQPDASLVTFPNLITGVLRIANSSRMHGAEGNGVFTLFHNREVRLNGLVGVRYVYLKEALDITENDQVVTYAPVFPGDGIGVLDHFGTSNSFYGGQVGFITSWIRPRFHIDLLAKVAMGDMSESADVYGATVIAPLGGQAQSAAGGLLALPSNSGHFHRDAFAVVPEVGVRLSFHITDWLHASAGYSFLYLSDVARPGDQVDTVINPNQIPTSLTSGLAGGPARPAFSFHSTDFYAHGVSFGLTLQY